MTFRTMMDSAQIVGDQALQLHRDAHVLIAAWHSLDREGMLQLHALLSHIAHDLKQVAHYIPEVNGHSPDTILMWENKTGYEETVMWDHDQLIERTEAWYGKVNDLKKALGDILAMLAKVTKPPFSLRFLQGVIASDLLMFAIAYKRVTDTALEPWLK